MRDDNGYWRAASASAILVSRTARRLISILYFTSSSFMSSIDHATTLPLALYNRWTSANASSSFANVTPGRRAEIRQLSWMRPKLRNQRKLGRTICDISSLYHHASHTSLQFGQECCWGCDTEIHLDKQHRRERISRLPSGACPIFAMQDRRKKYR